MDPLAAHRQAQEAFAGVLANVRADQLDAPTPCSEWAVKDLIEHVVGGNERVAQWAGSGERPPSRPDDLLAAHRAAAAAAQEVFARPGQLEATFALPFGQVPGSVLVVMRTTDVLTHAWDLATATGQSTDLEPELATTQLTLAHERVRPEFRGPGKFFGEEQPCLPGRPVAEQLAAFLGRKVP